MIKFKYSGDIFAISSDGMDLSHFENPINNSHKFDNSIIDFLVITDEFDQLIQSSSLDFTELPSNIFHTSSQINPSLNSILEEPVYRLSCDCSSVWVNSRNHHTASPLFFTRVDLGEDHSTDDHTVEIYSDDLILKLGL